MMRRWVYAAALAVALNAGVAGAAAANEAATKAVFATPHFEAVEAPSTLRYTFAVAGKLVKEPASDKVSIEVKDKRADGTMDVWLDLFSGENRRRFPGPAVGSSGNPLIAVLFKRDVDALSFITGGGTTYYRNRVRAAFRGPATAEPVTIEVDGQSIKATRVTLQPFADGPRAVEMGPFAERRYEIVVAPEVPGGLVRFASLTPGENEDDKPLLEEVLTYTGSGS